MDLITKNVFLNAIKCPTLGWMVYSKSIKKAESISDKLRMEEGLEIHERARTVFPEGYLIKGDNVSASQKTQELIKDKNIPLIFEAAFIADSFIAKADILKRENSGWHLVEIKSKVKGEDEIRGKDKDDLIDDIAYTTMVAIKSGVNIIKCSLMLISKDYRLGMPNINLFAEIEYTDEVLNRVKELCNLCDEALRTVSIQTQPTTEIKWECKACDIFEECMGQGINNHIFELPRITEKKFLELKRINALTIKDIPANFTLTPNQTKVKEAVDSGQAIVNQTGLKTALDSIIFPAYYLDFETMQTAIPLYSNIAPYDQIPTQYSLHICSAPGKVIKHFEHIGDPSTDPRRELAEKLVANCGHEGSIFTYSSFEKIIINSLATLFDDLRDDLKDLLNRPVDLKFIITEYYYHPNFHGSYSIKDVLPALVPELNYENMDVSQGLDASATFAYLAKGKYSDEEAKEKKNQLLEYCKLDTLAMIKVHERITGYT